METDDAAAAAASDGKSCCNIVSYETLTCFSLPKRLTEWQRFSSVARGTDEKPEMAFCTTQQNILFHCSSVM